MFGYALDDDIYFSETYVFPTPAEPLEHARRDALDRALLLLAIAAGVSYYKAAAPQSISIEAGSLTDYERIFVENLYRDGLGEFYFQNRIDPNRPIDWRISSVGPINASPLGLADTALVAIGGGKDSCVTIESLRESGHEMLLASVNNARPIQECVAAADIPAATVSRSISKTLLELNDNGALNGHVPVTAIVSLALVALAIIKDCNAVVMSNERSASVGNLSWGNREINHQWAKSYDAELLISDVVKRSIAQDLDYFSLLRPFSELDIAQRFAQSTRYDTSFTSCNRAFSIDEKKRPARWCNNCDKCRFVFLALAAHVSPSRLIDIFGHGLLDDESQIDGFEALCGWNANKPFECVGEVEESIVAFRMLGDSDEWRNHRVVKHINNTVLPQMTIKDGLYEEVFAASDLHNIPQRFSSILPASSPAEARSIDETSQADRSGFHVNNMHIDERTTGATFR